MSSAKDDTGFVKLLIGVFIAVGILVLIIEFYPSRKHDPNYKSEPVSYCYGSGSDFNAYFGSQEIVKRKLKSPRSARFPDLGDSDVIVRRLPHCEFEVWAYVDADNSFGANLRVDYYVKLQIGDKSGDVTELDSQIGQ